MSELKVRKRADTKSLLGSAYKDVVNNEDVPPPPQPLKDVHAYKDKGLKDRLLYADSAIRNQTRKLSPLGLRGLKLYKDACAHLLSLEEGEVFDGGEEDLESAKEMWRAVIQMYDRSLSYTACLRITRTSDAQELQDQLVNLQRTAFYARYGDMFAHVCRQLKNEAEIHKVLGWRTLQKKYWTEICQTLLDEKDAYERLHKGENCADKCPTHLAIFQACGRVGFNMRDMLQIIHLYGTRNEIVHANLIPLIKGGKFRTLAERLHDDLCALPLLIPDTEKTQFAIMIKLLEAIIDHWFSRYPDDPDNWEMWEPTPELWDYYKSLKGPNPKDEATVQKEISATIIEVIRKRRRDAQQDKEVIEAVSEAFGLDTGRKIKRVASSQLEAESDRVKRIKRDWDKIMNLAFNVRKISDTYLDEYGELCGPPEIVVDPSLDE